MRLHFFFFISLYFFQSAYATNIDKYFEYLDKCPQTLGPNGSYTDGEIEIILDKKKINEIMISANRDVGVIAEDNYWIWLNDAVRFPGGSYGVYGRIIWKCSLDGISGVAIMPLLPNRKVALNRNYRHATRSWEYELPRGGMNPHETPKQAAIREMKEETGYLADRIEPLGLMNPDSGTISSLVPVYLAEVTEKGASKPESSEAIASIDAFTIEELKQGFLDGYLTTLIYGKKTKVNLRDPFLAFALLQWELRQ